MVRSATHLSPDIVAFPPEADREAHARVSELGRAHAPLPLKSLAACLAIGSIGLLIVGILPLLLSELVAEGRISGEAAGSLVTAELMAIAVGSVAGLHMLGALPAKLVVAAGGILVLVANLTLLTPMPWLMLVAGCGAAGLGEGILIAPATVAIAGLRRPERAAAAYLAVQTMLQFLVAAFTPRLVWHGSLANGALLLLGGSGCVAILAGLCLPAALRPVAHEDGQGSIPRRGIMALLCTGLFQGAITTTWGYFALILGEHGYPPADQASMVALCLVAQITGALAAMGPAAPRSNRGLVMLGNFCLVGVVVLFLLFGVHHAIAWSFAALFGFLWLYISPSLTGLLVQVDPRRRAVIYQAPSQLAGAALMPLGAGAAVTSAGLNGAMEVGIAGFLLAGLLAATLRIRTSRD